MQNNWITNVADLYVNGTASIINISCKNISLTNTLVQNLSGIVNTASDVLRDVC